MAIITSGDLSDIYYQRTFRANGSTVTLKKISDTDWMLFGDLAEGDSEGFGDPAVEFPGVVVAHDPHGGMLDYFMPSLGTGYTVETLPNGDFLLDITPGSLEFKWVGIKFEESSNEVGILVEDAEPTWNMPLTANRDREPDWVYNPALVGDSGETTSLSNIYFVNVGGLWDGGNILIRPTNSEEYIQRLVIIVRIIPAE